MPTRMKKKIRIEAVDKLMITFIHCDTERKAVIIQISFLQGDKLVSGKFFLDILLFWNQKLIKIKCSR